ncbi:MAG: hypothetical protein IPI23_19310 [Bacteroidetes bacterium]|nr:hypothetical protein [Bacteroidota bacterium]
MLKQKKLHAEAKAIEFDTALKKLKLSLKLTKALIVGKEGQEAIVITKQIDTFLEAIEAFTSENNLLI